jgi:hypothetical protein
VGHGALELLLLADWTLRVRLPRIASKPATRPHQGFVRHDLFILAAIICMTLVVVIPQAVKHGLPGAMRALFAVAGALVVLVSLWFLATWLIEQSGQAEAGWKGAVASALGHLLRFALFGVIASALAAGLCLWHGLSPTVETIVAMTAAVVGGLAGCGARHRLGAARFWPSFRRFCLALLGSFLGGMLGILGPGNWGVTIGILVPLLIFAILAVTGRIVPPRAGTVPPTA